jgi:hypothetical protein
MVQDTGRYLKDKSHYQTLADDGSANNIDFG